MHRNGHGRRPTPPRNVSPRPAPRPARRRAARGAPRDGGLRVLAASSRSNSPSLPNLRFFLLLLPRVALFSRGSVLSFSFSLSLLFQRVSMAGSRWAQPPGLGASGRATHHGMPSRGAWRRPASRPEHHGVPHGVHDDAQRERPCHRLQDRPGQRGGKAPIKAPEKHANLWPSLTLTITK